MSQPAVSNALARLRELIDDPLFVRAPRGVEPTIKTRELITPVREALTLIGRHIGTTANPDLSNYKRLFRIAVIDPLEPIIMPAVVRTITSQAPGINIECIQPHPRVFDEIRAGAIDLACSAYPADMTNLVVRLIGPADIVVVTRRNHPGISKPLDLETFQRLPHVALIRELRGFTNIDRILAANMTPRRVVYMVSKIWSIPPMVERTDLVGMLPRAFVNAIIGNFDLDIHEPPTELPEQHLYMTWHANSEHDPGHIWLRESMMQAVLTN